jgi:hypothetical protein
MKEVISKRMVKQQQMRWTKRGAHLLLQVRVQTLNDDLREVFSHWYPEMATTDAESEVLSVVFSPRFEMVSYVALLAWAVTIIGLLRSLVK